MSAAQLRVIDSQLTAQLSQAARYLPGPAPAATASLAPGEYLVQAIDASGRVRGSPDAGNIPLLSAGQLAQARQSQVWATQAVGEEDTRITAAPLPGHPGWIAVAAISLEEYDATQSQVARGLAGAQVTCQVDVPAGTKARLDRDRIRQAVDNLLANAVRFAPAGSAIVLAAREDGPDVRIEVRDDGPGFPDTFLPHAFERFRRPDTGRSRDDGGAGLGLAIVAAICTAHGGRAMAANKPGGGATVSLWLPGAAL